MGLVEKPISPESKEYGNLGWRSPKDLAKVDGNEGLEWAGDARGNEMGQGSFQRDEMDQGSPKQCEYKPNDSIGLLELSRRKIYNRPKRGPASTSQMKTWQK